MTHWSTQYVAMSAVSQLCLLTDLCLQCFDTVGWVDRKGIRPVKMSGELLAWLPVWGEVQIAYGPAETTTTHHLLLQEIQIGFGFTFLVPAHPGSPGQNPESCKTVVVEVVVIVTH